MDLFIILSYSCEVMEEEITIQVITILSIYLEFLVIIWYGRWPHVS